MVNTRQTLASPDIQFDDPKLNRLVQLIRNLTTEVQKMQQLLAGGASGQVLEKSSSGDYQGGWQDNSAGGSVTGAKNVGEGVKLFKDVEGTLLSFRTLIDGPLVSISEDTDGVTIGVDIESIGTVTSVGIVSVDLQVDNSPIETTGAIGLTIKDAAVTYPKMQDASRDSIVLGRRVGEGKGDLEELGVDDLIDMGLAPASSSSVMSFGSPGFDGERGEEGFPGVVGLQGPKGDKGDRGPQGEEGPPGEEGPIGPMGIQGTTGPVGPTGSAGADGVPGEDGSQGIQGPVGPQGATGPAGAGLTGVPFLWFEEQPEQVMPTLPFDRGAAGVWSALQAYVGPGTALLLGVTAPGQNLDVVDSQPILDIVNNGYPTDTAGIRLSAYGALFNGPVLHFVRMNGTMSSPSALTSGQNFMSIGGRGFDGAPTGSVAGMQGITSEAWSPGHNGANLVFETTAIGTTTRVMTLTLSADGSTMIPQTTFSAVGASGSSDQTRNTVLLASALPLLSYKSTGSAANAKYWEWFANGNTHKLQTITDDLVTASRDVFVVTRSGVAVSTITFGNATDNPSYTFTGSQTPTHGSTTLLATSVALGNGAGSSSGTLTNAPAVGNPTKWVAINDNGTIRRIPAW